MNTFKIGDTFEKVTGDYTFKGEVRAVFTKKNGMVRIVGENADGLLFIFNESSIRHTNLQSLT